MITETGVCVNTKQCRGLASAFFLALLPGGEDGIVPILQKGKVGLSRLWRESVAERVLQPHLAEPGAALHSLLRIMAACGVAGDTRGPRSC